MQQNDHVDLRNLITQLLNASAPTADTDTQPDSFSELSALSAPPSQPIIDSSPISVELPSTDVPAVVQRLLNDMYQLRRQVDQMQTQLNHANRRVTDLEQQNTALRQELQQLRHPSQPQPPPPPAFPADEFPPLSQSQPDGPASRSLPPWRQSPHWPRTDHPDHLAERQRQRQAAAACAFAPPSDNPGYQFVYLPSKIRYTPGQLRANLRKLGVDNRRILDVHYPARHVVGLLVHNDFVADLVKYLDSKQIYPIQDFDPCDPKHLGDPKYADMSELDRAHVAFALHCTRMAKALSFIRVHVKLSVARYFHDNGWIPTATLDELQQSRVNARQQVATDFQTDVSDAEMSSVHSTRYSADSQDLSLSSGNSQ